MERCKLDHWAAVLDEIFRPLYEDRALRFPMLHLVWLKTVGPEIFCHSDILGLDGGVIRVQVSDSAWNDIIKSSEMRIITKFRHYVPKGEEVSKLHISIGKVAVFGNSNVCLPYRSRRRKQGMVEDKLNSEEIEFITADVADTELRGVLSRTLKRYYEIGGD